MGRNARWVVAATTALIVWGGPGVAAQTTRVADSGAPAPPTLGCADARIPERSASATWCFPVGTPMDPPPSAARSEHRVRWPSLDPGALTPAQSGVGTSSHARRGAVLGALVGGIATYLVLHHGGSTSLCDRSANQDAMGSRECWGLTALGGLAGAGVGWWVGGRFRVEHRQALPLPLR